MARSPGDAEEPIDGDTRRLTKRLRKHAEHVFTFLDCDHVPFENGVPDCTEPDLIPTMSQWGLVVLALMLLVGAKLSYRHRTQPTV